MARANDPERDRATDIDELRFEDGAFVIYDPSNPAAWLWTDAPIEL